jgi:hypothetical protein
VEAAPERLTSRHDDQLTRFILDHFTIYNYWFPPPIVIITVVAKWSLYIIYKTISWPTLQLYHIWPKNKYILLSTVAPITPLGNDAFSLALFWHCLTTVMPTARAGVTHVTFQRFQTTMRDEKDSRCVPYNCMEEKKVIRTMSWANVSLIVFFCCDLKSYNRLCARHHVRPTELKGQGSWKKILAFRATFSAFGMKKLQGGIFR